MSELFSESEIAVESPRLRWMKEHKVSTAETKATDPDFYPWCAWIGDLESAIRADKCGFGKTEHEAIVDLAIKQKLKLWNE